MIYNRVLLNNTSLFNPRKHLEKELNSKDASWICSMKLDS